MQEFLEAAGRREPLIGGRVAFSLPQGRLPPVEGIREVRRGWLVAGQPQYDLRLRGSIRGGVADTTAWQLNRRSGGQEIRRVFFSKKEFLLAS